MPQRRLLWLLLRSSMLVLGVADHVEVRGGDGAAGCCALCHEVEKPFGRRWKLLPTSPQLGGQLEWLRGRGAGRNRWRREGAKQRRK